MDSMAELKAAAADLETEAQAAAALAATLEQEQAQAQAAADAQAAAALAATLQAQAQAEQQPAPPSEPQPMDMESALDAYRTANEGLYATNTDLVQYNTALLDKVEALQLQNEQLRADRKEAEDAADRLQFYTTFAVMPMAVSADGNSRSDLSEAKYALQRQIVAHGVTHYDAVESLRPEMGMLPEKKTLGSFQQYVAHHMNLDQSGLYSLKKTQLINQMKRLAGYLAALDCFNCQCGRDLCEFIDRNAEELYFMCPRCLVTPYCSVVCAAKFQPLHALVCNSHPAWDSDSMNPINHFAMIPSAPALPPKAPSRWVIKYGQAGIPPG